MIPGQLIECLKLQDRINSRVNPLWLNAKNEWGRAIMVESVELLDHLGWKWWKYQTPDLAQARLELVDIWHFILSDALVDARGDVQAAARHILAQWDRSLSRFYVREDKETSTPMVELPLLRRIEVFASLAGLNREILITVFRSITEEVGLSSTALYETYLCKNALNHFRQDHGYKEGTYIKTWGGLEDNVVLASIVEDMRVISYEGLLVELEKAYAEVVK